MIKITPAEPLGTSAQQDALELLLETVRSRVEEAIAQGREWTATAKNGTRQVPPDEPVRPPCRPTRSRSGKAR